MAELLREFVLVSGRLIIALDDTSYGKSGRAIYGTGTHFDHAAKQNCAKFIHGHCRVLAGILLKCHGRWACLPMKQKNFKPKSEDGETKIDSAAVLVNALRKLFNLPVLVACDSWFGKCASANGRNVSASQRH